LTFIEDAADWEDSRVKRGDTAMWALNRLWALVVGIAD